MRESIVRTSDVAEIAGLTAENIYSSTVRIAEMNDKLEKSEAKRFWDSLTEDDKKDIIVVDGKKYVRKVYEHRKDVAKI